jgi:hypothetical protein
MFIVSSQVWSTMGSVIGRVTAVDREATGGRHMDHTQRRDSAGERGQVALGTLFLIVLSLWVALWAAPLPGI